jgi:hypothetical protein
MADKVFSGVVESFTVVISSALDSNTIETERETTDWGLSIKAMYQRGMRVYSKTKSKVLLEAYYVI